MSDIRLSVGAGIGQLGADLRKATSLAERQAKTMENAFGGLKVALTGIFAGEVVNRIRDLSQEVADYRNEIGDAATRTGLTTKTLAGLRAAAEASGLSFEQLNPALVKLSKGGGDAEKKLADFVRTVREARSPTEAAAFTAQTFGEEAGPKLLQAIGGTNEKLDAFVTFADRWGADVGPDAIDASARWQATTTALDTAVKGLTDRMFPLEQQADALVDAFLKVNALGVLTSAGFVQVQDSVTKLTRGFMLAVENMLLLPAALGGSIDAQTQGLKNLQQMTKDVQSAFSGDAFDEAFTRGSVALNMLEQDLRRMIETAGPDGPSGGIAGIGGTMENHVRPAIRMTLKDLQEIFLLEEQWKERRAELNAEISADEARLNETRERERKASLDRIAQHEQEARDFTVGLAQSGFDAVAGLLRATAGESEKGARRAAIAEKASAVFSIGVNTAQAIVKAMAIFGPPPSPAGIAGIATAAAVGGVQAGAVFAQPLPQAHTGTPRVGSNGGEVPYMLTGGEAVIQPAAADTIGRDLIDAANKGMPMSPKAVPAVVNYNRRSMARILRDVLRSDAAIPREMVSLGSSISMRTPYS